MKFLASLPEVKYYTPLQSKREGVFLWQDKGSALVRIWTPEPNPWGKQWVILPTIEQAKNDTAAYPNRLTFKCFYPQESFTEAKIIRNLHRSKFVHFYADQAPELISMYAFPSSDLWWVVYLIVKKNV